MSKIIEIVDKRCHHIYYEYKTLDEAYGHYPRDLVNLVEAPDWVGEGFGYDESREGDDRFIKPETSEGWAFDKNGMLWEPENVRSYERKSLHQASVDDTMEALRKIREGDTTHDWNAWLDLLDEYNRLVSETKNQESYPDDVVYPEYPKKPWETE